MADEKQVEEHYTSGRLFEAITAGLTEAGVPLDAVTIDDLAPVDEFHIGGREASEDFLSQLDVSDTHHILDIGCGVGGVSRFTVSRFGCHVTGIDLTSEFIDTARALSDLVGFGNRVTFHQGSALDMPFDDTAFDGAVMFHVGMNISDKHKLFTEAARVLKPGGLFGIFDVMALTDEPLTFPVPWSSVAETSAVASPNTYKEALTQAGFTIEAERNRHDFAVNFFRATRERMAGQEGPPPLGVHVAMGPTAPQKVANVMAAVEAGIIAPIELIAKRG